MLKSASAVLCLSVAVALTSMMLAPTAHASGLFSKTEVIFDEDVAIPSHSMQTRGFTLNQNATLKLEVKGVKNTDKGFDVYLMTEDNLAKFQAAKEFRHFPAFQGLQVSSATNTHDVSAGKYVFVVHNKYNLMKGMVVHIKATVNP
ncbi:hypothetical protein D7W79_34815 [Corallococcus exercitus]|uniref:hypothetical protein n=1 Tax=Corallococcus exercitus TaxID=2316736 RepID=UPI000EA2C976|nr:hypothetical protein [Corallococcus exercitus]RKG67918.1 hypothetical protein D7W79_34815 [Corallococcus exercitus]